MPEEILPGFFRLGVPLPGNPLKELNAWLVKGKNRHLLVDNGFNMPQAEQALREGLAKLGVDPADLDFFITHLHADHNGLTNRLASADAVIHMGLVDGQITNEAITNPELWERSMRVLGQHGFPLKGLDELLLNHPGKIYANESPLSFTPVEDGDELAYGDYVFKVVSTPGHTPGHMILHERERNFLISGDHILGKITPNITCWLGVKDSLGSYLASLDKVDALGAGVSCPGHRAIVENTHERIEELRAHHRRRLDEAEGIVRKLGHANAWDVASSMTWNLRGTWPEYRVAQKCFAVGEAVAHLDHLVCESKLAKTVMEDGQIRYTE